MAKQDPRYLAFAENETKPKRKGGGPLLLIRNLIILGAVCYGGWYLIPAGDKAELLEKIQLTSLPAGPVSAPSQAASQSAAAEGQPVTAAAPSSGGFMSNLMAMFRGTGVGGRSAGGPIDIRSFPLAYNNWQRTDYLNPETAPQAMRRMDRLLRTEPVALLDEAEMRGRTAAIYRAGRQELLIFIEAGTPPPPVAATPINPETVISAQPGTPVVLQAPEAVAALAAPEAPDPTLTSDALPQDAEEVVPAAEPELAEADAAADPLIDPPLPTVPIEGLTFTNHATRRGTVDLRAVLPSNRAIYVRGTTSMATVEEFLSRTKLAKMGLSD